MVSSTRFFTTLLIGATAIVASPTLVSRAGVTPLSAQEIASYEPYALLARAAYCSPAQLRTWSCGTACNALPGMQEVVSQGNAAQSHWFVGYYPTLNTIVVSNQGTAPNDFVASLTDADFVQIPLNPVLFPGVPLSVQVHSGFALDQAATASGKLTAVQALKTKYPSASITLVGLGHGGAISFLDAIYFKLHIPGVVIKVVTHGMPRVGNQAFANYIDSNLSDVSRITNMKDVVPILPGRFLGYVHSSGEKHILSPGNWVACAGQDNNDQQCSTGDVLNIFSGNVNDNPGPYEGIIIDGTACNA
ncbi:Lipase [Rhizoctonia solani]|uniref:Lipase n=1 Tax=Rhizoctonia solani TaxID=456999 RepID=A0A0K6GFD8_9AGAM|nr:Lipase [Rhizoctonia solani]